MDKYLKALRTHVCSVCVDSSEGGKCTLTDEEMCAVELYLPQIVDIVHDLDSDDMLDYYNELKEKICTDCRTRDGKGFCHLKDDVNCSLDRYFPHIVETIHKVDEAEAN